MYFSLRENVWCEMEVFSGHKIQTETNPMKYPSQTQPHLFSNPTVPRRKWPWCVHSLQLRVCLEKSRGPADWFGRCSITFIQFIYLLANYFIFLPA